MQLSLSNEESLVGAGHQPAPITSLPFVHTARRYYRSGGPVRPPDRPGDGRQRPPAAGKPSEPGRLEEVKVVTRSPLVNQRRDHYKGERGRRARRTLFLLFPARRPRGTRPPSRRKRPLSFLAPGRGRPPRPDAGGSPGGSSTTPGNGSLGSGVDEERGDMRYVVRIAGTQRAIESSNAHRARRRPGGPARPSAASKRPSPRPVRGGVGTRGGGQPAARAQMHVPCAARGRPRLAAGPPGAPDPPPGTRRVQHSSTARSPGGAAGGEREVGGLAHGRLQASASDRAGLPAELKHISKRRKRNQPGLPQ